MTWKCYLAIFKAESPVHIGYRQIGILKTTRYYITGRAMWGAITANLTRALFSNPTPNDYQAVGNFVRENIRTTYFYPAIKKNEASSDLSEYEVNDYLVFLPEYTEKGIIFGNKSKEWFEQTFVGSFVSTALESQTKTAEEGSLHEFEFIKDKVRITDTPTDTYWVGYLFVKENGEKNGVRIEECRSDDVMISGESLSKILSLIQVGGERNYGLGRLRLPNGKIHKVNDNKIFGKFYFESSGESPVLKNLNLAIAHVDVNGVKLKQGEIEPLVGLEWSDKGTGQNVSMAIICVTPGSEISGKCILGEYGLIRCSTNK